MQNVIHVITRLDWGGSAQNTFLTAIGHDRTRFHPMIVAGDPGPWDAQGGMVATEERIRLLQDHGVPLELIPTLSREINLIKDFQTLKTLVRIFRRERPTIVHTHTSKAGVLGRIAAWITGVPLVVHTPHGHVFYGHFGPVVSWIFFLIEYVLAWRTTRLIALTEAEREEHLVRRVGQAHQFSVIPSGIDLDRFRQAVPARTNPLPDFPCGPHAVIIGSVGWLTEVKGHRYFIEAIAKVKPQFPNLHAVIIGSGPLLDDYRQLAADLGIRSSIHFLLKRDDIPECLATMDVFVLPSLNEGMGRALIEAMAVGLPVIATQVGGVPAVVTHEVNGLLVPQADSDALAFALKRLLDDPSMARTLGHAARQDITHKFSAVSMVQAIEAVYEESLPNSGHAPHQVSSQPFPAP